MPRFHHAHIFIHLSISHASALDLRYLAHYFFTHPTPMLWHSSIPIHVAALWLQLKFCAVLHDLDCRAAHICTRMGVCACRRTSESPLPPSSAHFCGFSYVSYTIFALLLYCRFPETFSPLSVHFSHLLLSIWFSVFIRDFLHQLTSQLVITFPFSGLWSSLFLICDVALLCSFVVSFVFSSVYPCVRVSTWRQRS